MMENEYLTMLLYRSNQRDLERRAQRRQRVHDALYRENKKRTKHTLTFRPLYWLRRRVVQPQQPRSDDAQACGASSLAT